MRTKSWKPPSFSPGTTLMSTHGSRYRVIDECWSRFRVHWVNRGEAAFEAQRLDATPARVLLRVGAADPPSSFGTYGAAAWLAPPSEELYERRGDSDWVTPSRLGHPRIAAVVDAGLLIVTEAPNPGVGSPYRDRTMVSSRLAQPLPFAALARVEGATLRTMLQGALQQARRPLGAGAAIAVGAAISDALAWIHGSCAEHSSGPRSVWHGRLDARHVFVSSAGVCQVAHPIRLIPREMSGGCAALEGPYAHEGEHRRGWDALPAPPAAATDDLFELGVMLFETTTGRTPWQGDWGKASYRSSAHRDAPSMRSVASNVPPALEDCVEGLLAPATRRFTSHQAALLLADARAAYDGLEDIVALAAVVKALGAVNARGPGPPELAVLGDGRDGTREPVVLHTEETS